MQLNVKKVKSPETKDITSRTHKNKNKSPERHWKLKKNEGKKTFVLKSDWKFCLQAAAVLLWHVKVCGNVGMFESASMICLRRFGKQNRDRQKKSSYTIEVQHFFSLPVKLFKNLQISNQKLNNFSSLPICLYKSSNSSHTIK